MSITHTTRTGKDNSAMHDVSARAWNEPHIVDLTGLTGQTLWIPYNAKIADITHADANKYTLDLAAALSETRTIIAVIINSVRIAGTGEFYVYPNEGTRHLDCLRIYRCPFVIIASGTNRLQYNLGTPNDDWDVYCLGYVVLAA